MVAGQKWTFQSFHDSANPDCIIYRFGPLGIGENRNTSPMNRENESPMSGGETGSPMSGEIETMNDDDPPES